MLVDLYNLSTRIIFTHRSRYMWVRAMPRSLLHIYACKIPECNKDTPEINGQMVPWANATYGLREYTMRPHRIFPHIIHGCPRACKNQIWKSSKSRLLEYTTLFIENSTIYRAWIRNRRRWVRRIAPHSHSEVWAASSRVHESTWSKGTRLNCLMSSCRLNWTAWCALAGFRSACHWPKLVPTALAWWSSNSACFQKLPLPKVMLWNLHDRPVETLVLHFPRVSSHKNETNIHYFPYRSLSRIKHVFWFAGCFWKLKKDNWYILKGLSICSNCIWTYLHPNLTGEMATETKKTCGHETNRTAADITTGWYHTTTGCTHSSLQCTCFYNFSSVKKRWRLNCGAIHVPNSIFYFTELKASTKNKRSSKKKPHLVRSLSHHIVPNSTYASSSMLPLHSSCCQGNLCHCDAKNAKIGSSKRQSMSRRPGVAKHLLNVGNPVFRPRCGMSCLLWCTGLQSMPKPWFFRYFSKSVWPNPSATLCVQLVFRDLLLHYSTSSWKKLHQCQLQRHRQRNIYNKAIEQNSFVATNHAGSKKTLQI